VEKPVLKAVSAAAERGSKKKRSMWQLEEIKGMSHIFVSK